MNKNQYVIFGSGGLAKEVIGYLVEMYGDNHGIRAVVSTEPFNNPAYDRFKVQSELKPNEYPYAKFILAVADPKVKKAIVEKNEDRWISFIHSSANVSPFARIGKGCVLAAQSILAGDPIIGDFVFLNTNATVGHDSVVGDYSTLYPNSEVCGNCNIGSDCVFGIGAFVVPGVTLPSKTKVGAGSVVWNSVSEPCLLIGNPAAPKIKSA